MLHRNHFHQFFNDRMLDYDSFDLSFKNQNLLHQNPLHQNLLHHHSLDRIHLHGLLRIHDPLSRLMRHLPKDLHL